MPISESRVVPLARGLFAYLQPRGTWGWSNAALVCGEDRGLLVDTLFDLALTEQMLIELRRATPVAAAIEVVVNTHANGDHCYGNAALPQASVVATRAARDEMRQMPPERMAGLLRAARILRPWDRGGRWVGAVLRRLGLPVAAGFLDAAAYVCGAFGAFAFDGVPQRLPDRTFAERLDLELAGRRVELLEVGPAHTLGDAIVHVPDARVVLAGDVVFAEAHPLVWYGTVSDAVRACARIVELAPEVVLPGHGPVVELAAVRGQIEYLEALLAECRGFVAAELPVDEAARRLVRAGFGPRTEAERLIVNVDAAYRELTGRATRPHVIELFGRMARLAREGASPSGAGV
jgi:cyclase